MSAVLSNSVQDEVLATIKGFADLLKTGFQNPEGITGSLKLHIPEYPEYGFIASFADELTIEWDDLDRDIDTVVSMPIASMERVFREFQFLDWRDPEIIGTITIEGDYSLANHLSRSCQRPADLTKARLKRASELHKEKGYRDLNTVEVLNAPTQMQVLEAIQEGRPVIIKGLNLNTTLGEWTIDKLAQQFGDSIVRVRSATQSQTMSEFVDELKAFEISSGENANKQDKKPYTEGAGLPKSMWESFGPMFFDREDFNPPQLWLGSVPTHIPTSGLHRDPLTGFLLQVIGSKRLDLYSADQEALLYPHKAYNNY